jgi:hypothetical protein
MLADAAAVAAEQQRWQRERAYEQRTQGWIALIITVLAIAFIIAAQSPCDYDGCADTVHYFGED